MAMNYVLEEIYWCGRSNKVKTEKPISATLGGLDITAACAKALEIVMNYLEYRFDADFWEITCKEWEDGVGGAKRMDISADMKDGYAQRSFALHVKKW